jgi:hypothetical protein
MSNPAYEKYIESLETTYKTFKKMSSSLPTDNTYEGGRNAKGEPHGYGKMIYLGEGRKNGFGKMVYSNGSIYEGNWINGIKNGFGKQILDSGIVYEGEWSNDKKSGFGKQSWDSGTVYEGEWSNDKKNGQGIITYKNSSGYNNGDQYNGSWKDDVKNGNGVLTKSKGSILNEKWENGVLKLSEGNDTITLIINHFRVANCPFEPKGIYTGELKNNIPNGKGSFTVKFTDTDREIEKIYNGDWLNGIPHGFGIFEIIQIYKSNKQTEIDIYEGEWKFGEFVKGVYTNKYNGKIYNHNLDHSGADYGKVLGSY